MRRAWVTLAAFAMVGPVAAGPAMAQPADAAAEAAALLAAGDEDGARRLIAAAAAASEYPPLFFAELARETSGALLDGELEAGERFTRVAMEALAGTPLSRAADFVGLANSRSEFCAVLGDLECLQQSSAAALGAMDGPTGDYEKSEQREATKWRAIALYAAGQRQEARPLVELLVAAIAKPDPESLANELDSLASRPGMAHSLDLALRREAIAILEAAPHRPEHFMDNRLHHNLGATYEAAGMLAEAEASYRAAWRISSAEFDPDSIGAISDSSALARVLAAQDRRDEALSLYRRNWEIADAYDDWTLDLSDEFGDWIVALLATGREAEAEETSARVIREVEATQGIGGDTLSQYLNIRAIVLSDTGRFEDAEILYRRAEATNSGGHLGGGASLTSNLAFIIEQQGRHAEAEPLRRRAYAAIIDNPIISPFSPQRISAGLGLAGNLSRQGKQAEADALFEEMVALARRLPEPSNATLGAAAAAQARHMIATARAGEATPLSRLALQASAGRLALLGPGSSERAYLAAARGQRDAALLHIEAMLARGAVDAGGFAELFEAAQRAGANAAASAIALNAAQTLAGRAGAGAALSGWRAAQADVADLDRRLAAAAELGKAGDRERAALARRRVAAIARLQAAEGALAQGFSRFFDLARPQPAPLAAVRAALAGDEGLLVLVAPSGGAAEFPGAVLALTREGQVAAPIALAPERLASLLARLHDGLAAREAGFTAAQGYDAPTVTYDRAAAHELYRALFSAPAVAALVAGKPRWTLAPQRQLVGLSFDALVIAPPTGEDADPAALRATGWLGIERALATTPSIGALALARAQDAPLGGVSEPFFGLGDPAFRGAPDPPLSPPEEPRLRSAAAATRAPGEADGYYRGGVADLEALARLERLPGTDAEIRRLAGLLGAGDDAVLTQLAATEAAVRAYDAQGALGRARLVVFATHGLVVADMDGGAAEPALALTPPQGVAQPALAPDNDGLLTATEAAALTLGADWVILSACNTAAGEGADPEGLSGLARGFFYAGARALLVSHFPVSDRATPELTAAAVAARRDEGMSPAGALQAARRALLADPRDDALGLSLAHPKAWAALALIDPGGD